MNKNRDKKVKEKYKEIADKRAMLRKYEIDKGKRWNGLWERYLEQHSKSYPLYYPFQYEFNIESEYVNDNPFSSVSAWTPANVHFVKSKIYFDLCLFIRKLEENKNNTFDFYFIVVPDENIKMDDYFYSLISINGDMNIVNQILETFDNDVILGKYNG